MPPTQVGPDPAALVRLSQRIYARAPLFRRLQEFAVRRSLDTVRPNRDPGTAMTLAQSDILAPIALAMAGVIVAGLERIARLLRRV